MNLYNEIPLDDFLANLGIKGKLPLDYASVQSAEKAIAMRTQPGFDHFLSAMLRRLMLEHEQVEKYNKNIPDWNEMNAKSTRHVENYLSANASKFIALEYWVLPEVKRDLIMIHMESELGKWLEPVGYQEKFLPAYKSGHMICGRKGPRLTYKWSDDLQAPLPPDTMFCF